MAAQKKKPEEKPYVQFSKRMVTAILLFWGIIRLWTVVAVWQNPDSGNPMVRIVQGVDDIATVIVISYTGNSISEKIAKGYYNMRAKELDNEKEEKEKDKDKEAEGLG